MAQNISKYLNIFGDSDEAVIENFYLDNYLNKDKDDVVSILKEKKIPYLILGGGDKVVWQYPYKGSLLSRNDTVFLLTDKDHKVPDFSNMSKKEVLNICKALDIKCTLKGYGYAYKQNIKKGSVITKDKEYIIEFKERY